MQEKRDEGTLALRAQGIGDDDMARLVAFLRIGSDQLANRWCIASGESFDALILGQDETLPMPLHAPLGASVPILHLVEPVHFEGTPGQLGKPLSFQALVEQLQWIERRESEPREAARPVPPLLVEQVVDEPEEDAEWAPTMLASEVWPEVAPAREPARAARSAAAPARSNAVLREGDLYRLERLPAATALGGDRHLTTLASLLTIRPLRLEELVTQSGLDAADCDTALRQLLALGVLLVTDSRPTPARDRQPGVRRRSEPGAEASTGVLARWRDRLGLGGRG